MFKKGLNKLYIALADSFQEVYGGYIINGTEASDIVYDELYAGVSEALANYLPQFNEFDFALVVARAEDEARKACRGDIA